MLGESTVYGYESNEQGEYRERVLFMSIEWTNEITLGWIDDSVLSLLKRQGQCVGILVADIEVFSH